MEEEILFHRSLLLPNQIFGIPHTLFYILVLGGFYISLIFSVKYALIVVPIFLALRLICKNDPDCLAILWDFLFEPDFFEG